MIKSDVKFALRALLRQPAYSLINVLGLALGLTVCLLVAAYIQHELSFEDCHSKRDRIYRVSVNYTSPGEAMSYGEFAGSDANLPGRGGYRQVPSPDRRIED